MGVESTRLPFVLKKIGHWFVQSIRENERDVQKYCSELTVVILPNVDNILLTMAPDKTLDGSKPEEMNTCDEQFLQASEDDCDKGTDIVLTRTLSGSSVHENMDFRLLDEQKRRYIAQLNDTHEAMRRLVT